MFSDLNVHRARLNYDEGWYIDKSIDLQGVRENEVQLLRGNDHTSVITRQKKTFLCVPPPSLLIW